ncbi:MAG: DUF4214 domain-containing protein, partial [Planctomycetaceae bacterium]|nr:DUF4214 domain-containing protein [Planctomycetaceae bacterium]
VESLYENLLGRTGDSAGTAFWTTNLGAGTNRATVAADFIGSTESDTRVIDGDYTAFLARVGETSEVNSWLAQVQNGSMTLPEVAAGIIGSSEYTTRASQETAPATQLVLTTAPPSSVTAGSSFGLAITAENQYGNLDTTYTGPVTLALSGGTAGAVLGGITTVNAINGVAAFSGLTIDQAGTGYTLTASSGNLTQAEAADITVSA